MNVRGCVKWAYNIVSYRSHAPESISYRGRLLISTNIVSLSNESSDETRDLHPQKTLNECCIFLLHQTSSCITASRENFAWWCVTRCKSVMCYAPLVARSRTQHKGNRFGQVRVQSHKIQDKRCIQYKVFMYKTRQHRDQQGLSVAPKKRT